MLKPFITLFTLVFSTYSVQLIQSLSKLQAKALIHDNFILEVDHEEHKELVHCMTFPECVCHGKVPILDLCDQVGEEITLNFFEGITANLYKMEINAHNNSTQKNKTNPHHQGLSYSQYLPSARLAQQVTLTDTDMESALKIGDVAVMKWKYNADASFDMIWEWSKLSWVGIGFCPTMSNCDMMVINLVSGVPVILDTFSTGHDYPRTDTQNDINLISSNVNTTGYKVRFNRQLNTGDNQDQVLTKGSTYTFCLAYSGGLSMEMHDFDGTFQFKFDSGQFGTIALKQGGDVLFYLHAIILFIAWGVVADFGLIVGRYYKTINSYIWIHTFSFLFVDLATVVLTILMLVKGNENEEEGGEGEGEENGVLEAHNVISFVILIVIFIQHGMGVVMKHFLEQKSKRNNQFVFLIKLAHIILGTSIYLAAKIDMILGLIRNEEKVLLIIAIIWFVLLMLVGVLLEVRKQSNKNIKNKIQPSNAVHLNTQQLMLIDMINQNASTEEINYKLPDLLWCTLNQDIYDFTDYQHPGGNFILKSVQGREISRYFYGAFGLENTTMQPYTHSQKAYELIQTKYIGSIASSLLKEDRGVQLKSTSWNLLKQEQFTNNISLFLFQQNGTNISLNQNASDFGQHFSISLQEIGGKIRMYTKVFTMSPPCVQFRNKVLEYFNTKSGELPKMEVTQSDTVPLIIKKYNFPGALSAQIFNHKGLVYMEGPFGRGLELKQSMKAVAFVGGTGLLPFLDLLDHLLMKSIYAVLKKTNDQKAEQLFNKNSQLGDDFEFSLNGTFLNEEEFIGREWIRQLYKINQENNLKFFNMQLRYSNGKLDDAIPTFQNRFSQEFVLKELGDFSKQVYICGPPSMNYSLLQIINQSQQNQEKVMIV